MSNHTRNRCTGITELDPVQGLVEYVEDVKPYHTKIIEVLVEYVFTETVNVSITESLIIEES